MKDVLLVDDDGELVQSLARALSPLIAPLTLIAAGNAAKALEISSSVSPKVAVVDLCLDEQEGVASGFALIRDLVARDGSLRVIVLTGHGSVENGVKALRVGAASFLEKPVDPAHLAALVLDGVRQADLRRMYDRLDASAASPLRTKLVGSSAAIERLREQIRFAASNSQQVLLLGETGTGKGLCARLIHEMSARAKARFVPYQPNFGGGDLVQSELFGHVRGAFTGATESRRGLVSEAHAGTLFLDELDEIPLDTQVRLLDLVQEKRIRPVGADDFQPVDCRIVAASNRPTAELISSGKVRKDLYHRLAHCVIEIPALRSRLEDLPELSRGVLLELRTREEVNVFDIDPDVYAALASHTWPGNIREFQAVVQGAAYRAQFAGRTSIVPADIPLSTNSNSNSNSKGEGAFAERLAVFKLALVQEALARHAGNQVRAARDLGLDRGTLKRILDRKDSA